MLSWARVSCWTSSGSRRWRGVRWGAWARGPGRHGRARVRRLHGARRRYGVFGGFADKTWPREALVGVCCGTARCSSRSSPAWRERGGKTGGPLDPPRITKGSGGLPWHGPQRVRDGTAGVQHGESESESVAMSSVQKSVSAPWSRHPGVLQSSGAPIQAGFVENEGGSESESEAQFRRKRRVKGAVVRKSWIVALPRCISAAPVRYAARCVPRKSSQNFGPARLGGGAQAELRDRTTRRRVSKN